MVTDDGKNQPIVTVVGTSLASTPPPVSSLPAYVDLFTTTPLYLVFDVIDSDGKYLHELKAGNFYFDCHCVECRRGTPFKGANNSTTGGSLAIGTFLAEAACTRHDHRIKIFVSIFRVWNSEKNDFDLNFQKVGQTPSVEDIIGADVARFKPVFSKEDFAELKRATGLASHGIGIGSFVYLRRIFERLIEKHRKEYETAHGQISDYHKLRMAEKIQALAEVLPPALVRNKDAYSILSTGIHELTENACRQYFDVIRSAIIRILEQDLKAEQEARADRDLEESVRRIGSEIGKGDGR